METHQSQSKRPNIIIMLADDMGYSDIGCFGSEIITPNLDRMAESGVRFTQMYNYARCCPSRASLFTGVYPHQAGIGHMVGDLGHPSYRGFLTDRCVTVAEVLRSSGYRTGLMGKWHIGGTYDLETPELWNPGSPGFPTPTTRGYDEFYGTLEGCGSYFNPHTLMEQESFIQAENDDYYYTHEISSRAAQFIARHAHEEQPFFLCVTYTAPHWPLHALPEDIAKYEHVYRKGWDAVRTARHEEMIAKGVVNPRWTISLRDPQAPSWEDVPHKEWEASRMAVYAAMVDALDQGIGKVLGELSRQQVDDNTLIFFLSDNGGSAEFLAENGHVQYLLYPMRDGRMPTLGNYPHITPGSQDTYMSYGLPWANVSNAPFRLYKHWVHEGGISTPCIVRWPEKMRTSGGVEHTPMHITDIAATCIHAAGAAYPREFKGHEIEPLAGESFIPLIEGNRWHRDTPIIFEHEGNCAVRHGSWKLVREYGKPWELYDMDDDRPEMENLISRKRNTADELESEFTDWSQRVGVVPWDEMKEIAPL